MTHRTAVRLAATAWLALLVASPAFAEAVPPSGNAVFDRTIALADEHLYSTDLLPAFHQAAAALIAAEPKPLDADEAVRLLLASLGTSHTGRYTPDRIDYYELTDVFRFALRRDIRRLFPPDGAVAYDGVGLVSKVIDGRRFVTDVYDGLPAKAAGVMVGDEIVAVDGQPFAEIGSFRGKAGSAVDLRVRHTSDASPVTIHLPVVRIQPGDAFVTAITDSVRVIDAGNRKIGVVHLWTYTRGDITDLLNRELATTLKDVDGLILDLRSRWGGAPADAAETFVGGSAGTTMNERGKVSYVNTRFHKPIVAIIDGGTRSGMELLAYSLKKNGVPLVGAPTAGNVLAATVYLLPDNSLLELPVADVTVDGIRLEGNPVQPDISVPFDIRYANGADPQFDAALAELTRRLDS